MVYHLEFEKPIVELEAKIAELGQLPNSGDMQEEITRMREKSERILIQTYSKLAPDQKVQVARHPSRPHFLDYAKRLIQDFTPLAGDRYFGEDAALLGGLGRFRGQSVVVMGQEKGHDTQSRIHHNFGMTKPEGYRKAQRLMDLADRFRLPLVSFVDTPGAYPGVQAEERGQAEAIARAIARCLELRVPFVSVVIGEGGSGGAVAIATANRVLMLEHAVYSVISPEGCASILWRSAENARDAAEALKMTAQDLTRLGVVDQIIEEPLGGAHRHPSETIQTVGRALETAVAELSGHDGDALRRERREKFLAMGRTGLA